MHWALRYLNQPYAEANCGELYMQVQREVFGREIQVPVPMGQRQRQQTMLAAIDFEAQPVQQPLDGDAVLLLQGSSLYHLGVFALIEQQASVLHALRRPGVACIHPMHRLAALGFKHCGYFRPC